MRRIPLLLLLSLAASPLAADTFTVINTNDSGAGSLRQAIQDANNNPGADTIAFAIPGSGVHTIAPATDLPQITDGVTIDGYTQPGASVNTDPIATNAVLLILLDGSANTNDKGFSVGASAGGTTIRGLAFINWSRAIDLAGPAALVTGNFIGVDPLGTMGFGSQTGIHYAGTDATTLIGGTAAADRNLISGNGSNEIEVATAGVTIQGNLIGTDPTGMLGLSGGFGYGIAGQLFTPGSGAIVGGTAPGAGNVISGNQIAIQTRFGAATWLIQGNRIGINAAGSGPVRNTIGIGLDGSGTIVGGTSPGEANEIAHNAIGIYVTGGGTDNSIRGNSIHDNESLGIHIDGDTPNYNDPLDEDEGGNRLQNFPILRSIEHNGPQGAGSTRILGKLDSAPSTTFDLDFYSNPVCANFPRDFLGGETYLGSSQVTTDGSGHADIDVTLPVQTDPAARISATATDPAGNTSEFSQRIAYFINPPSGPAAGGTAFTISGTDFANPATIVVGGTPAIGVTFTNDHTLDATMPAFPPGTAQDVVVTTPDGTAGTIIKGWVADFLDVPGGQQFYSFVTTLVSNGITAGMGGGNYGVDDPTLRQQMAVFLLKAKHGLCYTPPACVAATFTDVPCSSGFAPWIYELVAEGVSGGCGDGTTFCPTSAVLRQQMAVFLLKAYEPPGYTPPVCTELFPDIPCSNPFAAWVNELLRRQITGGCSGGLYCPMDPATRGQMAVFLTKTFHLQ